jgi:HK97 family phage prohead protease
MAIERAAFGLKEIKFAATEGATAAEMMFSGYGAVFGNVDSYGDVIQPGAFADTLAAAQKSGQFPAMLMQHGGWGIGADDMTPVGIWTSLAEDGVGLKVEGKLADTPRGREAYALLKMTPRPAIDGLSIGYIAKELGAAQQARRAAAHLKKVDLMEVSLVTFPANGKARIASVKSAAGDFSDRDFEQLMQDAGLTRKEARIVMNQGFRHLKAMQDAGSEELDELAAAIKRNTSFIQIT